MSLQNLLGISLAQITPQKEMVRRLLDGAARHIADAKLKAISAETRFSSAYTAIRMLADVGLHVHGFRALTSKPGHHQRNVIVRKNGVNPQRQAIMLGRSRCYGVAVAMYERGARKADNGGGGRSAGACLAPRSSCIDPRVYVCRCALSACRRTMPLWLSKYLFLSGIPEGQGAR